MTQRVTRQYVSALGPGDGKLRVTRQYAYVLMTLTAPMVAEDLTLNETVTAEVAHGTNDSLTLDENATYTLIAAGGQAVNDSMTINDSVSSELWHIQSVADSLVLNDTIDTGGSEWHRSINDALTLADSCARIIVESVEDSLILDDNTGFFWIQNDFNPAGDIMSFVEVATGEKGGSPLLYDSFSLNDIASYALLQQQNVTQALWLTDSAVGYNSTIRKTITDSLVLSTLLSRAKQYGVVDSFTLTDTLSKKNGVVSDTFSFVESATIGRARAIHDSFTLYGTVEYHAEFLRSVVDSLALGHTLTYYLIRPCTEKQYTPFTGESTVSGLPDAPSGTLPPVLGLPVGTRFQLAYPAAGAFTSVVALPAPQFENRDKIAATRINRETRGGRLSVFADPLWPKVNTVSCNFTGLTTAEVLTFQNFVETYLGLEINITDWEGHEWVGVITNPNEPATHDGKDRWSIGFEFEGVIVDTDSPGSSMSLNEVVTFEIV